MLDLTNLIGLQRPKRTRSVLWLEKAQQCQQMFYELGTCLVLGTVGLRPSLGTVLPTCLVIHCQKSCNPLFSHFRPKKPILRFCHPSHLQRISNVLSIEAGSGVEIRNVNSTFWPKKAKKRFTARETFAYQASWKHCLAGNDKQKSNVAFDLPPNNPPLE